MLVSWGAWPRDLKHSADGTMGSIWPGDWTRCGLVTGPAVFWGQGSLQSGEWTWCGLQTGLDAVWSLGLMWSGDLPDAISRLGSV
ncbi:hypothetical protein chiPu_0018095 [Chiloscyllium punctatum]|uniref:Uncharacterized protein n=1 Tax=Chiloscyllium punctatum TaxID=137246 RepID=A0A401RL97_CHIPU|nr:hypothetical protein [Chiloscyllium punctatum]